MANGQLNILGAAYGLGDVTTAVQESVITGTPQTLSVEATDSMFSDTWPGNPNKTLAIIYNYDGGDPQVAFAMEGGVINISFKDQTAAKSFKADNLTSSELIIYGCVYGTSDVTSIVQGLVSTQQGLSITVNPQTLGGDPNPGVLKSFVIVGSYGGMPIVSIYKDGDVIQLGSQNIQAAAVRVYGKYAFCLDTSGTLWNMNTIFWQNVAGGLQSMCFRSDEDLSYWQIPQAAGDAQISWMTTFGGTMTPTNAEASQVFAGYDGDTWAITSNNVVMRWDVANSVWDKYSVAPLMALAIVNKDLQWALDTNNNILVRNNDSDLFQVVSPGPGTSSVTFITASQDGTLYVVDSNGAVFTYTGNDDPWMPFGDPSFPVRSLCIPSIDRAWLVGQDGSVLFIGETNPAAVTDSLSRKFLPQWDTESVFDETQSTHLYIVNRAAQLAGTNGQFGQFILQQLQPMTSPPNAGVFRSAMCQGLYDADFLAPYNNPTFFGQPTWESHFYDDSTGLNYRGNPSPTALTNGVRLFNASLVAMKLPTPDIHAAGYNLGLALHYFTDLTQPMHAGNYSYLSSFPFGYHTDFEGYTMAQQAALVPQPVVTGFVPRGVADPQTLYKTTSAYTKTTYLQQVINAKDYFSWKWSPATWQQAVFAILPQIINDAVANTAQLIYLWASLAQPATIAEGLKLPEMTLEEIG